MHCGERARWLRSGHGALVELRRDIGVRCRPPRKRQAIALAWCPDVTGNASPEVIDRVAERRRAVALARHYREFEGLSIAQIADRLGRSPATVKAYFYDPSDANKGLRREQVAKQEVARSGVTCPPRHHGVNSVLGGPFFARDWTVQRVWDVWGSDA